MRAKRCTRCAATIAYVARMGSALPLHRYRDPLCGPVKGWRCTAWPWSRCGLPRLKRRYGTPLAMAFAKNATSRSTPLGGPSQHRRLDVLIPPITHPKLQADKAATAYGLRQPWFTRANSEDVQQADSRARRRACRSRVHAAHVPDGLAGAPSKPSANSVSLDGGLPSVPSKRMFCARRSQSEPGPSEVRSLQANAA